MLDAYERRLAGFPRRGTLLEEAIELLQFGSIGTWIPKPQRPPLPPRKFEFADGLKRPNWKHEKGSRS